MRIAGFARAKDADALAARFAEKGRAIHLFSSKNVAALAVDTNIKILPHALGDVLQPPLEASELLTITQIACAEGPVLPVSSSPAVSRKDIGVLLPAYEAALTSALCDCETETQTHITAYWRPEKHARDAENHIASPRALALPAGPLRTADEHDRTKHLDRTLSLQKTDLRSLLLKRLQGVCGALDVTPERGEKLFSAWAKASPQTRRELQETARRLASEYDVQITFAEPSPALDSPRISIVNLHPRKVSAARRRLNLPPLAARGDIEAARLYAAPGADAEEAYYRLIAFADSIGAARPNAPLDFAKRTPCPYGLCLLRTAHKGEMSFKSAA